MTRKRPTSRRRWRCPPSTSRGWSAFSQAAPPQRFPASSSAPAAASSSCSRSRARRVECFSRAALLIWTRWEPHSRRSSPASPISSPTWKPFPATLFSEETMNYPPVKTIEEFKQQPQEYQNAVRKIVRSHALNELYGATVFDEPAIKLAPTPYSKWLTCRVAMEEYHHHVRFKELADQIGVKPEEMDTKNKRPLNIFEVRLEGWEHFCVIKMLGDLAEILQVEDLLHCSFVPLRNIARTTMPEEKFHAQFGLDFCVDLIESPEGRAKVQRAVNGFYPEAPKFFGSSGSKNNEIFRKYGLKLRSNEDMRADYMARAKSTVDPLGITLPEVRQAA